MNVDLICNHKTLIDPAISLIDKCKILSPICAETQSAFNLFEVYFCTFNGRSLLFTLVAILAIILIFKFICSVVEDWIAPAIVYLSTWLGLSETLAGVTLIAFANGAGDVITAIVASEAPEGVSYNIGALYGAGLFVLTIVIGLTIIKSPEKIIVNKAMIFRDIGFYLVASAFILYCGTTGFITWYNSLILLLIYIILVIVVIIHDHIKKGQKPHIKIRPDEEQLMADNEKDSEKQKRFAGILKRLTSEEVVKLKMLFTHVYNYMQHKKLIRKEDESMLGKCIDVIDYPSHIVRRLTLPPANFEEYNHWNAIIWPYFGILFLTWAFNVPVSKLWFLLIPISFVLSIFFYKTRPAKNDEIPRYFILLVILGIISGILWTKFLSTVLIDLLTMTGLLTNLPSTYLGLTVIAIGNALPDGLTTIAIAKKGKAIMGITGGVAGQLFGLLIGFGFSMLKRTLMSGEPAEFDIFNMDKLDKNILGLVVIGFTVLTLLTIFIYSIVRGYLFDKILSTILMSYYGVFLIVSTIIAIRGMV